MRDCILAGYSTLTELADSPQSKEQFPGPQELFKANLKKGALPLWFKDDVTWTRPIDFHPWLARENKTRGNPLAFYPRATASAEKSALDRGRQLRPLSDFADLLESRLLFGLDELGIMRRNLRRGALPMHFMDGQLWIHKATFFHWLDQLKEHGWGRRPATVSYVVGDIFEMWSTAMTKELVS